MGGRGSEQDVDLEQRTMSFIDRQLSARSGRLKSDIW